MYHFQWHQQYNIIIENFVKGVIGIKKKDMIQNLLFSLYIVKYKSVTIVERLFLS